MNHHPPPSPIHRVARAEPPGKLNLFLELLGKRDDGYHEIDTVMVPIDWRDSLEIRVAEEPGVRLRVGWLPSETELAGRLGVADDDDRRRRLFEIPTDERNLVSRALGLFARRYRIREGFDVRLGKRIPAAAGLGGASSDAAAALLIAARLYAIPEDSPELVELAAEIGSDVPFFLGHAGQPLAAARARGRGERIEPLSLPAPLNLSVAYPDRGLSTAAVYAVAGSPAEPRSADEMVAALATGDPRGVAQRLHNRLRAPAVTLEPRVAEVLQELADSGPLGAEMSGSGAACFAIHPSAEAAAADVARLGNRPRPRMLLAPARTTAVPTRVEIG